MKWIVFLIAYAFVLLSIGCSGVKRNAEASDVRLTPSLLDLGNVPQSKSGLAAEFFLSNHEDRTIQIESISSSCGCTNLTCSENQVLPFGTVKIYATLACTVPGTHSSHVKIGMKGGDRFLEADVVWHVSAPVVVETDFVQFGRIKDKINYEKSLSIKVESDVNEAELSCDSEPAGLIAAEICFDRLYLTLTPSDQYDTTQGNVRINLKGQVVWEVRVFWEPDRPAVTAIPRIVDFTIDKRTNDFKLLLRGSGIEDIAVVRKPDGVSMEKSTKVNGGFILVFRQNNPAHQSSSEMIELLVNTVAEEERHVIPLTLPVRFVDLPATNNQ